MDHDPGDNGPAAPDSDEAQRIDTDRRRFLYQSAVLGVGLALESSCAPDGEAPGLASARQSVLPAGGIYGYPHRTTVQAGGTLRLHYLTDLPSFRVKLYRQGATLVPRHTTGWMSAAGTPGQPLGPWNSSGLVSSDWRWPHVDLPLDAAWPPGVYVAVLEARDAAGNVVVASNGQADARSARALFVVRPAAPTSRILYKLSLATFHAYNAAGGSSLYEGHLLGDAPDGAGGRHAGYRLTLLRPGGGTGGPCSAIPDPHDTTDAAATPLNTFAHWDIHLIRWLEQQGLAADFCTDVDLHADASLLAPYSLLISSGHDEYWSHEMREHTDAFVRRGGNVTFLSGNTCYWRIYFDDEDGDGVPDAIVCDKRTPDGGYGGGYGADVWWEQRPENTTTGVSCRLGGWIYPPPAPQSGDSLGYRVQRASSWVYAGSGAVEGTAFGVAERVVAYEFDGLDHEPDPELPGTGARRPTTRDGSPADFVILGLCDVPPLPALSIPPREPELASLPSRATLGYFTRAGTVFTAGTTEWPRVLAMNEPVAHAVTRNLVKGLSAPRGIAGLARFTDSGREDILYTVPLDSGTGIGLWTMQGEDVTGGGYVSRAQVAGWRLVGAGDFNGSGTQDLLFHHAQTGQLAVWFLGGADRRTVLGGELVSTLQDPRWTLAAVADFNGDGRPDLVFQDRATGELSIWLMGGTSGTMRVRAVPVDRVQHPRWTLVAARDFDRDGRPDLVFHDAATGEVAIWRMGGADGATFVSAGAVARVQDPQWALVGAGDLDGDGAPDLLFQHRTSGRLVAWFMGGPSGLQVLREAEVPRGLAAPAACGPSFRGWQRQPYGGTLAGDTPALARLTDGQVASFSRGTDGVIYLNVHASGAMWQGWTLLTGLSVAQGDRVAVGTRADGRLAAFVRGADGTVACRAQSGGDPRAWSAWASLPGLGVLQGDALSVARAGDGRLFLGGRQASSPGSWAPNFLNWETAPGSGQWQGWVAQPTGGTLPGDTLVLAPLADGRIASFGRGTDGVLYLNVHAAGAPWQGWTLLTGVSVAQGDRPAAGVYPDGRLALFVRDTGGRLRMAVQQSAQDARTWSSWTSVPGLVVAAGDPVTVVSGGQGRLVLCVRGPGGVLHCAQERSEGVWCGWAPASGLEASPGEGFAAVQAGDGRVVAAGRQASASGTFSPCALNWQL